MKIYVSHPRHGYDYVKNLYEPLRQSHLDRNHKIFFPHENSDLPFDTRKLLKTFDLLLAEVSMPSTGQGIELGWANAGLIPIICIYQKGSKPASSLAAITHVFIEYDSPSDMIAKIDEFLKGFHK
jgi:hypothetical protein